MIIFLLRLLFSQSVCQYGTQQQVVKLGTKIGHYLAQNAVAATNAEAAAAAAAARRRRRS
jgi:hypothetical protein